MEKICVKLVRSTISQKPAKRATVRSLGLRKINSVVEHDATPSILGMIASVSHLVKVVESAEKPAKKAAAKPAAAKKAPAKKAAAETATTEKE